jgi:catechol 2,3-dioxygenase-like lactoylglutathione lyase family enzyme
VPVTEIAGLKVRFVAGFGPLVRDPQISKAFYVDTLSLPLEARPEDPDYFHSEKVDGVRHFGLWPLALAAESCFGTGSWPDSIPTPHSWMEFDVENVATATQVLKDRGYKVLVECRKEPWGQTVTRMLSPEGILIGLTFTPWLR